MHTHVLKIGFIWLSGKYYFLESIGKRVITVIVSDHYIIGTELMILSSIYKAQAYH